MESIPIYTFLFVNRILQFKNYSIEKQSPQGYLKNNTAHKPKNFSSQFHGFCIYYHLEITRVECNQICIAFTSPSWG